ncbi:hypothetical protein BKA62DRAFT_833998 [Auriculariales sp. MPI-PUGE-AT-0066]|nr:hypothetical protein BKA62DRAFT_833998 [Auriculariales sp. MPI-PUGE-AT-0066]
MFSITRAVVFLVALMAVSISAAPVCDPNDPSCSFIEGDVTFNDRDCTSNCGTI